MEEPIQPINHSRPTVVDQMIEDFWTNQARLGDACYRGDVAQAREAIERGANVHMAMFTEYGEIEGTITVTYVAARMGHIAILRDVLFPAGADPNSNDGPLEGACGNDQPEAVTVLLEHGADPNSTNRFGETPLIIAADHGHIDCIRALSNWCARNRVMLNVNAVSSYDGDFNRKAGMTALDCALGEHAMALNDGQAEAAETYANIIAYLRDELGGLRAAELPRPKRPKSAMKKR
jgi:hypothetical protein